jgi:hypothetical protein
MIAAFPTTVVSAAPRITVAAIGARPAITPAATEHTKGNRAFRRVRSLVNRFRLVGLRAAIPKPTLG